MMQKNRKKNLNLDFSYKKISTFEIKGKKQMASKLFEFLEQFMIDIFWWYWPNWIKLVP